MQLLSSGKVEWIEQLKKVKAKEREMKLKEKARQSDQPAKGSKSFFLNVTHTFVFVFGDSRYSEQHLRKFATCKTSFEKSSGGDSRKESPAIPRGLIAKEGLENTSEIESVPPK